MRQANHGSSETARMRLSPLHIKPLKWIGLFQLYPIVLLWKGFLFDLLFKETGYDAFYSLKQDAISCRGYGNTFSKHSIILQKADFSHICRLWYEEICPL